MSDIVRQTYEEEIVALKIEIERLRTALATERLEMRGMHDSMFELRERLATARKAIEDYLSGNYDNPRRYRPNECRHNTFYWLPCEQCIDEHFTTALAAMEDKS